MDRILAPKMRELDTLCYQSKIWATKTLTLVHANMWEKLHIKGW